MTCGIDFVALPIQLRIMRFRAGLRQDQLAVRSGVNVKTVSSFETGARIFSIRLDQLDQLVAACGLSIAGLFAIVPNKEELYVIEHMNPTGQIRRKKREAAPFRRMREPVDPLRTVRRIG